MNKKFILASFNILLFVIVSILTDISLYMIHYNMFIFIIVIQVLLFILSIISYFSRKIFIYNIGVFILFVVNVIGCYYLVYLEDSFSSVSNIITSKYEYKEYHLYVLKSTKYHDILDLESKNIGIISNNYEYNCEVLNNTISIRCSSYDELYAMVDDLNTGNIQGIFHPDDFDKLDVISSDYRDIYHITVKYPK